jgi:hypothetical protein
MFHQTEKTKNEKCSGQNLGNQTQMPTFLLIFSGSLGHTQLLARSPFYSEKQNSGT